MLQSSGNRDLVQLQQRQNPFYLSRRRLR